MAHKSFLKSFFSFHFITIFGILIALFVVHISNEIQPLSSFLFNPTLYLLASGVAFTTRILLWLIVEKGAMFEIKHVFIRCIQDIIIINAVLLSTLSFSFLVETFFM